MQSGVRIAGEAGGWRERRRRRRSLRLASSSCGASEPGTPMATSPAWSSLSLVICGGGERGMGGRGEGRGEKRREGREQREEVGKRERGNGASEAREPLSIIALCAAREGGDITIAWPRSDHRRTKERAKRGLTRTATVDATATEPPEKEPHLTEASRAKRDGRTSRDALAIRKTASWGSWVPVASSTCGRRWLGRRIAGSQWRAAT